MAGDFNMDYTIIDNILSVIQPFGNKTRKKSCVNKDKNDQTLDCIYVAPETEWNFEQISMLGKDHGTAIKYTYNLIQPASYIQNRAVKIQTDYTKFGGRAYLAVNRVVDYDDYQWAFYSDMQYMNSDKRYRYKFIVQHFSDGTIRISCPYDAVSYLSLNNKITSTDTYENAFWGDWKYIHGSKRYNPDPRFKYVSQEIQASYNQLSYLTPKKKISADDYQWARFATRSYLEDEPSRVKTKTYLVDLTKYLE